MFPISAVTGKGVRELMFYAYEMLKTIPKLYHSEDEEDMVVYDIKEEELFTVRKKMIYT